MNTGFLIFAGGEHPDEVDDSEDIIQDDEDSDGDNFDESDDVEDD